MLGDSTCCRTGDRLTFSGSPEQSGFALLLCLAHIYVLSHNCYNMYRSTLREINPPHTWRRIYSKLENPQRSLLASTSLLLSFPIMHTQKKPRHFFSSKNVKDKPQNRHHLMKSRSALVFLILSTHLNRSA